MQLGHVAQRHRDPACHLLARAVAGVGPGAGRRRAGRDHQRQQGQQPVEGSDHQAWHEQAARARRVVEAVPVHEDDGVGDQEDGGHEVHHDQIGVQLGVDDDAPEDGLRQNARDQTAAQPHQIAPAR